MILFGFKFTLLIEPREPETEKRKLPEGLTVSEVKTVTCYL